jgi:hypothetical protein
VTICVIVGLLLQRSREQAIDDLQRDTRNLTAALALYARGIVTSVDLALVGARDSLALLEFTEHGPARAESATRFCAATSNASACRSSCACLTPMLGPCRHQH